LESDRHIECVARGESLEQSAENRAEAVTLKIPRSNAPRAELSLVSSRMSRGPNRTGMKGSVHVRRRPRSPLIDSASHQLFCSDLSTVSSGLTRKTASWDDDGHRSANEMTFVRHYREVPPARERLVRMIRIV